MGLNELRPPVTLARSCPALPVHPRGDTCLFLFALVLTIVGTYVIRSCCHNSQELLFKPSDLHFSMEPFIFHHN